MTSRQDDGFAAVWSHARTLSRRQLLRSAGLGAGALAFGGFTTTACTSDTPSNPAGTDSGATGPSRSAPDAIAAALANVFSDLDPTVASFVGTLAINRFIYDSLYRLDPFPPRTELIPQLATELPREVDPTTYRVGLREGVRFHDGTEFTADDVVFTIERIKDPDVGSLFARYFKIIDSVEAVGDLDVELRLAAPTTLLAQRLVLVAGMSRAAVKKSPDALTIAPVGTGPYQVASVVSAQEVQLDRFPDYTGPSEYHYDTLRISVNADGNARTAALRSGETQIIEEVPGSSFESLAGIDDVEVEGARGGHMTGLMFHCGKPPFDDVRVRQAVMFAIDRDSITQTSFFGHAEPVWGGEIPADNPDFAEPELIYRYDPDHAQQLMSEAGYGDGDIPVDFLAGNLEYLASQAPVIEENLRAIGFRPNLIPGELESLYSRVSEGSYHLFLIKSDTSALGATDVEFLLRWTYYGTLPEQFMYWNKQARTQVERLLDEALTTSDDAARSGALAEAQNIIQSEIPIGRLHRSDYLTGWSAALQGFRPVPNPGFVLDGVSG